MTALRQAARRLCSRLGTKTGLFGPAAAQEKAATLAAMKPYDFGITDVDDEARKIFWALENDPMEGENDLTLADVTRIVQAMYNLQENKDGAQSNN